MSCKDFSNFSIRLREWIARRSPTGNSDEFNDLALALFKLQFSFNPPYQRYCLSQGFSPQTVPHWTYIPAIPIQGFKEFDLTCLSPKTREFVFYSSGTTEQRPSRHFHSPESLRIYELSLLEWFKAALDESPGQRRMIFLTPPPAETPHSSLVHMFETLRGAYGEAASAFLGHATRAGAWEIDFRKLVSVLQNPGEIPLLLCGTAFNFVHLIDYLDENCLRFELPLNSRILETGGYKGRSRTVPKGELRALLASHFGIPADHILSEYGMCELSSQAYDFPDGLFRFPPWSRVRIISPETGREVAEGETGLIRLYDLANVYSVMVIQTEDIGLRRGEGFELVGRASMAEARGCSLMSIG